MASSPATIQRTAPARASSLDRGDDIERSAGPGGDLADITDAIADHRLAVAHRPRSRCYCTSNAW